LDPAKICPFYFLPNHKDTGQELNTVAHIKKSFLLNGLATLSTAEDSAAFFELTAAAAAAVAASSG
jgi:hypothetical protein